VKPEKNKKHNEFLLYIGFTLFIFFICWGCTSATTSIPVHGEFAGQKIETTVDSELAKYYLEHYLRNDKTNPELDAIIDQIDQSSNGRLPTREYLKYLSKEFSVDFATIYLAKIILEDKCNKHIQCLFNKEFKKVKLSIKKGDFQLLPISSSYILLFVPSLFYKSQPENGGDFAEPRKVITKIGLENHLIEIEETGTIEENAVLIAKEIISYSHLNKKLILVSASKSGPEVALALDKLLDSQQTHWVKAWLNIGGVLQGSPLADSALCWPKRWFVKLIFLFKGWDFACVESMTTERSRARFKQLNIPKHILVINYIGIPLSGDITIRARDGYLDLQSEGPNDGLVLITDEMAPDSITIAELGLDHYFLDPDINIKTLALARTIINYLESQQVYNFQRRFGGTDYECKKNSL
jgi:hypothetical protein